MLVTFPVGIKSINHMSDAYAFQIHAGLFPLIEAIHTSQCDVRVMITTQNTGDMRL